MNTTQTDSESVPVSKFQVGANHERPETPKTAPETEFVAKRPAEHPVAAAIAAPETVAPVEATGALEETPEAKPEPQIGEKRDLDSTTTLAAAPAPKEVIEDKEKPAPETSDEPDFKKQKIEAEPAVQPSEDTAGPAPAAAATAPTSGGPKKSARSKKEKVKEALKNIPKEGISTRTRSRTKGT